MIIFLFELFLVELSLEIFILENHLSSIFFNILQVIFQILKIFSKIYQTRGKPFDNDFMKYFYLNFFIIQV